MARRTRAVEVGPAADVVDEASVERVEEHAVDREVAALGVLLGGAEDDALGLSAVDVRPVGAERRDLDVEPARAEDFDDAERRADGDGAAEQAADLFGPGRGGDIVILRLEAEQFVAHAAAGEERLVARVAQGADRHRRRIRARAAWAATGPA